MSMKKLPASRAFVSHFRPSRQGVSAAGYVKMKWPRVYVLFAGCEIRDERRGVMGYLHVSCVVVLLLVKANM